MRIHALFVVAALVAPAALASCGSDSTSSTFQPDGGADATDEAAPPAFALRVDPPTASATIAIGTPGAPIPFRAFARPLAGGPETEVTAQATWAIDATALGSVGAGILTPAGVGGKGSVTAVYQGASARSSVTLKLTGDLFGAGTDMMSKATFGAATPDPNAANKPAVEYPLEGAVLPANLPPIDVQWSQDGDSNLWRVHFSSPDVLDVTFYATSRAVSVDAASWSLVAASAPDAPIAIVVDGVGPAKLVRTSDVRSIVVTADTIDQSAIYVWKNSQGRFRIIDVIQQKEFDFPSDVAVLGPNPPACSGCHVVSRDGTRFAYVYNGGGFQFGTLKYDSAQKLFTSKLAADPANLRGTHATFNPNEASSRPAIMVSTPDAATIGVEHAVGTVQLELLDPDTGAVVPSNLASVLGGLAAPAGPASLMPDWAPSGDFVVFAAYDSSSYHVRLVGDEIARSSIMEMSARYDAQSGFVFGAPTPLVKVPANETPDTGEANFLPMVSPDGLAVAFTRANGWWSVPSSSGPMNQTGRIAIVRRSDKQVIELKGGEAGPQKNWHSTWPQWAPTMGKRYAWLAFSTQRPYGHLLTPSSPENAQCSLILGQIQCKHLWIMAVDRAKLASGTADPSAAPFWVPGQTLAAQYVSPQWTKAVIAPPK